MSDAMLPGEDLIEWRVRRSAELRAEAHTAWLRGDFDACFNLGMEAHDVARGHADPAGEPTP